MCFILVQRTHYKIEILTVSTFFPSFDLRRSEISTFCAVCNLYSAKICMVLDLHISMHISILPVPLYILFCLHYIELDCIYAPFSDCFELYHRYN